MQDSNGMVDISGKDITVRTATANGCITLGQEGFDILKTGTCIKGDILETAKIAAINAVKATPSIIPMCHPIPIEAVKVEFTTNEKDKSVLISVKVKSSGKTGV